MKSKKRKGRRGDEIEPLRLIFYGIQCGICEKESWLSCPGKLIDFYIWKRDYDEHLHGFTKKNRERGLGLNREIKTTLAIDGEKKFKQELQDAARQMRVLASETKSATSVFGANQKIR